jgi:hypothetical protein
MAPTASARRLPAASIATALGRASGIFSGIAKSAARSDPSANMPGTPGKNSSPTSMPLLVASAPTR